MLETLDFYDLQRTEDFEKELLRDVRDIGLRTEMWDLDIEVELVERYAVWVRSTGRGARAVGDGAREAWYKGLLGELRVERDSLVRETGGLMRRVVRSMTGGEVEGLDFEIVPDLDVRAFSLDSIPSSPARSWQTTSGSEISAGDTDGMEEVGSTERQTHTEQSPVGASDAWEDDETDLIDFTTPRTLSPQARGNDLEDLIDLEPSPSDGRDLADGITSIMQSTGLCEMSEVDRLLS